MKVVINSCYGGFGVSQKVFEYLDKVNAPKYIDDIYLECNRNDPYLVEAVETLGEQASGAYSKLEVVEWPDAVPYSIDEYDGWEKVILDVAGLLNKHAEEIEKAHTPLSHDLHHYRNHLNTLRGPK